MVGGDRSFSGEARGDRRHGIVGHGDDHHRSPSDGVRPIEVEWRERIRKLPRCAPAHPHGTAR
jgi:hypothetical protein